VRKLATTKTSKTLFNPYNELSKPVDDRTAPGVRQQNLRLYLNSHYALHTKMLWVYFSPTYTEAKRSGVPLVNFTTFRKAESVLNTEKHFEKATKSRKRPSSTVISSTLWSVADELGINPIIWPVIPFYAHVAGKLSVKRKPTPQEINKYKHYLEEILQIYKPEKVLAIGKEAEEAMKILGIEAGYIEHPRRGKKAFKTAIAKHLKKIR